MQKRISIKNHYREVQLIARRSMLGLVIICILILLLIGRLAYLQIYKHELYSTLSTKNAIDLVPVEPTRGLIYDRNGILLVENIPVFSLDVIPYQVTDMQGILTNLPKIIDISDNDIAQFKKQIKQHRRFDEIPLKLRLSEAEVARFTENQYRFPGVIIKARLIRHYPYGESFSHVLGYVGRINAKELNEIDQTNYSASHYIGKLGIEKFYEEDLHGKVGYEVVESDARGKPIRVLKEISGTPGKNLYLTLDSKLQLAAEHALDGRKGAIVAIQPSTGQILAMVSEPSYDPDIFVLGISQKDYNELQQADDKPLFNRALRGQYPFGSTIKPFYALQGLDTGTTTPEYTIYDNGKFMLRNATHVYHDWRRNGHGRVNLGRAITVSCDIYFYELANKMGIRLMDDILTKFGFGAVTGIDIDDELPGAIATPELKRKLTGTRWYGGDTIVSAIGQGFMQVTPLQLASATAALATRGQRFMPYLLLGQQLPGKAYTPEHAIPVEPVTLKDNKYWDIVIKAMEDVVGSSEGTAYRYGRKHSYTIAAKTGTAAVVKRQKADEEDRPENVIEKFRDHHLFIAFAPVDNPQLALAVVTENSDFAIETARDIFDYYLGNQQNDRQLQSQTKISGT